MENQGTFEKELEFIRNRIAGLRANAKDNMSARDLSLSIGMNPNYISKVESGEFNPSLEVISYICDYFNISLEQFFTKKYIRPELINELVNNVSDWDEETLKHFIAISRLKQEKE